jgi:hypothetical protein
VNEAEWLACTDAPRMLRATRGRAGERELARLIDAILGRAARRPAEGPYGLLVEAGRRYSQDRSTRGELEEAHRAFAAAFRAAGAQVPPELLDPLRADCIVWDYWGHLRWLAGLLVDAAGGPVGMAEKAGLLRCLVGNPFRPSPVADPAWLAWNGGTVRKLAEAIYDERAFDRLPVLADALEDAGCSDPELLGHLRGPGPHARGCWAVDLILGKE